jgi:lambda repressor-like predicted transcriptional regulator
MHFLALQNVWSWISSYFKRRAQPQSGDCAKASERTFLTTPKNRLERSLETTSGITAELRAKFAKRAMARRAIVMPLLESKGWSRRKWAIEAGVSKNSVYEYLGGKRKLSGANRRALAEVLGLEPRDLPE